jgi:hypothetical protein
VERKGEEHIPSTFTASLWIVYIPKRKTKTIITEGISLKTFSNVYPFESNFDFVLLADTVFNGSSWVPGVLRIKES